MRKFLTYFLFLTLSLAIVAGKGEVRAESAAERRTTVGGKLFRAMLAADLDINEKKSAGGALTLVVLYSKDERAAKDMGSLLTKSTRPGKSSNIRNLPVEFVTTNDLSFEEFQEKNIAGIFIAEPLKKDELNKVIDFGVASHLIVYSPFEGDVEKGVLGGLSVEMRVRPYVNKKTLKASKIRIKPFFMKVTKQHE